MSSESNTTTNHDDTRRWVDEHDGQPASVRGTENGDEAGVLRIDFPGGAGEDQPEHGDWDEGFPKVEETKFAFPHQEQKADGEDSPFFKLVKRCPRAGSPAVGYLR